MEVEWGQLQLEQSTWAMSARVEKIASQKLQMQVPKSGQVQFVRGIAISGAQPAKVATPP
jgi:cell division protein FtsL